MFSREHMKLAAVAVVSGLVALSAPAAAGAVYDAVNADKVDGKHAVKSDATVKNRKGKLVATSATTGRLPNNIIAKAPDADRLDGLDSTKLHYVNLDVMSVYTASGATGNTGYGPPFGLHLIDNGTSTVGATVAIPPDFTGTTMKVHLLWHIDQTSCHIQLLPNSTAVSHTGRALSSGGSATSGLTGTGVFDVPTTANQVKHTVLTLGPRQDTEPLRAGDSYGFSFYRNDGDDTCTADLVIGGMYVTY
jgi:hypothetical protein